MKILLAPSKTMDPYPVEELHLPPFKEKTEFLMKELQRYSVDDLRKLYKTSEIIAQHNHQRFRSFFEVHQAYHAYTGYMFKMMDKPSLNEKATDYIKDHLMIVSGLYGLVSMRDTIGLYRLPMGVKVQMPLFEYWKDTLTDYLKDEWVVDLMSQEYRDAFETSKLDITTIDFVMIKNGQEHRPAMALKKARGLMVKEMALNNVHDKKALKQCVVDGYRYDDSLSSENTFVYKKE